MKSLEQIMSIETADIYVEIRLDPVAHPPRVGSIVDLLIARGLASEPQEAIYVVAVDPEQVRYVACVAKGEYHSVTVPIAAVLAIPLLAGADHFVIAHNHPSGKLLPSRQDFDMTEAIMDAANVAGMTLDDSIIIAPDGRSLSFKDSHILEAPAPRKLEVRA